MCTHRALSATHEELETVVVTHHEKRKKGIVSHQNETVNAENSTRSLEHSFHDLVQRYSSLRNQSSDLKNVNFNLIRAYQYTIF